MLLGEQTQNAVMYKTSLEEPLSYPPHLLCRPKSLFARIVHSMFANGSCGEGGSAGREPYASPKMCNGPKKALTGNGEETQSPSTCAGSKSSTEAGSSNN